MFLLVISINHTNSIFKVSWWILLLGKNPLHRRCNGPEIVFIVNFNQLMNVNPNDQVIASMGQEIERVTISGTKRHPLGLRISWVSSYCLHMIGIWIVALCRRWLQSHRRRLLLLFPLLIDTIYVEPVKVRQSMSTSEMRGKRNDSRES